MSEPDRFLCPGCASARTCARPVAERLRLVGPVGEGCLGKAFGLASCVLVALFLLPLGGCFWTGLGLLCLALGALAGLQGVLLPDAEARGAARRWICLRCGKEWDPEA